MKAITKAIKLNLYTEGDFSSYFDGIPSEITNRLADGYFDDNGDWPHGNWILIPIADISGIENIDINDYHVTDVEINYDASLDDDGNFITSARCWFGFSSSRKLIEEID